MDLIIGFILCVILLTISKLVFFVRLKQNKQLYSVTINNVFVEKIPYGRRDQYLEKVKYRSTLKMIIDKKSKEIKILVDNI